MENFQGTSVTAYAPDHATRVPTARLCDFLPRKRRWPLPYRSTIACGDLQGPFDMCKSIPAEVLGFLTVDSELLATSSKNVGTYKSCSRSPMRYIDQFAATLTHKIVRNL